MPALELIILRKALAAAALLLALTALLLTGCQPQATDYTKSAPAGSTASGFTAPTGPGAPQAPK
ncbi:MAG: hypothetical protein FJ315_05015 [SAR202 cluster bacterium]|nr:hypothetical protein [SAR202 cluster bacterium]